MKKKALILAVVIFISLTGAAQAATDTAIQKISMEVHDVAKIRIVGNEVVSLEIVAPKVGGEKPPAAIDSSTRLQYTSVVGYRTSRKITVGWASPEKTIGGCLLLIDTNGSQTGKGNLGTSGGQKILGDNVEDLITGVGSCWTGTAGNDGAELNYTLRVEDISQLKVEARVINVAFTFTEDQ